MKTITAMKRSDRQNWWHRGTMGLLLSLLAATSVLAPAQGLISSSSTNGADLDALFLPPTNSVAVNPGVTIENNNSGGDAVFGSSTNWALINSGTLNGNNDGVNFGDGGSVNNLTTNALIEGINGGVEITNGFGSVANAGTITTISAYGNDGVLLGSGGSVSNLTANALIMGGMNGVKVRGTNGMVVNNGSIRGYGDGVFLGGGGSVNNLTTNALITGGWNGVEITNGFGFVANAGTIGSANSAGVLLGSGGSVSNLTANARITSGRNGVEIEGANGIVVNAGTVSGGDSDGVFLGNGGSVNNLMTNALIAGGNNGVEITNGFGSVANAGTISGTNRNGVLLSGGSVNNLTNAFITGGNNGVEINNGLGTVANGGLISGTNYAGVYFTKGGGVSNNLSGLITGGAVGVEIDSGTGSVVNAGTIIAGKGVEMNSGGTVNNRSGGTIMGGGDDGVDIYGGAGYVTNGGSITGGNDGVYLDGGSVNNLPGGTIAGTNNDGVDIRGGAGSVVNADKIIGYDTTTILGSGVYMALGGSVSNLSSGTIAGVGYDGVEIFGGAGYVNNAGSITAVKHDGVFIGSGGGVNNQSDGIIAGSYNGVEISGTNSWVFNAGTIIGTNNDGVHFNSSGSVVNAGSITASSDGVYLDQGGSVNNLSGGTITGYNGVTISVGPGSVANAGTIVGTNNTGVFYGAGGSVNNLAGGSISGNSAGVFINGGAGFVTNAGSIMGTNGDGIDMNFAGSVNNELGGTIIGSASGVHIAGGPATVVNAGTIIGSNGTAILLLDNYTNTVTLQTGSDVQGNIVAGGFNGGTNNTAILQGNGSFDNGFTNFQTLTVQANSTGWDLNGSNAFSTGASVQYGLLRVNGQLTTPLVTVADATGGLGGAGTINGIVDNHGYFAPGTANNPIGTLTINGAMTNWGGYYANVNKAGNSDLIQVNGRATIRSGNVMVHPALGTYAPNTVYTVLTATNGVSGVYDGVSTIYPLFFSAALSNDMNDAFVTLNQKPITSVASTYNQDAVAGALDRSMNSPSSTMSNLITGFLQLSSVAQAQAALNSLGGEIHGTLGVLDVLQQDDFNNAIAQRTGRISANGRSGEFATSWKPVQLASGGSWLPPLDQAEDQPSQSFWLQGVGSFGHLEGDGNAQGGDYAIGGMSGGKDYRITPKLLAGVGLGFTRDNADVGGPGANGTVNAYQIGGYGGYVNGPWHLDGILSYGYLTTDTKRFINVGSFSQQVNGSYAGGVFSLSTEGGYAFKYDRLTAEPSIGLDYAHLWQDSFSETGPAAGDNYGLDVHSVERDSVCTTLGLRLAAQLGRKGGVQFIPALHALWGHEFADRYADVNASFVGGSSTFDTHGVKLGADSALLGGGLTVAFNKTVQGFVNYDASLNSQLNSSTVSGGVSISW